ncbi:MAG: hypothetical protein ABL958_02750 [Bdellovibrionia bacterium]
MATEFILLLTGVMLIASLFVNTLKATFKESAPMLGARIEAHLETAPGFPLRQDKKSAWEPAPKKPKEVNP